MGRVAGVPPKSQTTPSPLSPQHKVSLTPAPELVLETPWAEWQVYTPTFQSFA